MTSNQNISPFVAALGPALDGAAPIVRRHLACERQALHTGFLRRLWWRGPWGYLAARFLHLNGDPGAEEVRFELRNKLVVNGGGVVMLWHRTHYRRSRPISGIGLVRWDADRGVLVDSIGQTKRLEVELVPRVDDQAVVMTSRRQWFCIAGIRLPLPCFLFGSARTREWEEPGGRLGLSLILHHPLLGAYAGYEAILAPEGLS